MKSVKIKCPYCGRNAVLRPASYVYGDKAIDEYLYVCSAYPECNSYVGVHKGTLKPKGTLANGDLRNKRIHAHKKLAKLWENGIMSKKQAYRWIQDKFCLSSQQAHIGQFSEYRCDELMRECDKALKNNSVACS